MAQTASAHVWYDVLIISAHAAPKLPQPMTDAAAGGTFVSRAGLANKPMSAPVHARELRRAPSIDARPRSLQHS
jgi:hypothetical protein